MLRYDPAGHPLLSPAAQDLGSDQLDAQAERAAYLLGIADTEFEGKEAARLTTAIVLQINYALRRDEREGGEKVAESKGDQSVRYAAPKDGVVPPVDPEAAAIVAQVKASAAPAHAPRVSGSIPNVFTW